MTLENVFGYLYDIDTRTQRLLHQSGYGRHGTLREELCPYPADAQENFLLGMAEEMVSLLEQLHDKLSYLRRPVHGEQVLKKGRDGRYGYLMANGAVRDLSCGQALEAKLATGAGEPCWVCTRLEHDGTDYYLAGCPGIALEGLTIRERW